jgi:hypothetical protein
MPQVCPKCARLNPAEAAYCHFDGNLLRGAATPQTDFGVRAFSAPFPFSPGLACHNFAELAVACHRDPAAALEHLRLGRFEAFLTSQGRPDLALAVREALRAPDRRRGLDDWIGNLPGRPLRPAQLRVAPPEIHLGVLPVGQSAQCEVVLHNDGQRLLHGTVTSECPWLLLGEKPRVRQKLFQVHDQETLALYVRGDSLGAFPRPQTAKVVFDSNGGKVTLRVTVTVPIKPFEHGVLAGATTPRQLAEKAREAPREAAVLVQGGEVARWYRANGWSYPVSGPKVSGIGAVQQLLEALGLVSPPRVELDTVAVFLAGAPGERIREELTVLTQERRAVVAHATCDQPWLRVSRTRFHGRCATIPLTVPVVPHEPGTTLRCQVTVAANGNQRFVVPVTLAISEVERPGALEPEDLVEAAPPEPPALAPPPLLFTRRPARWRHLTPVLVLLLGLLAAAGHDLWQRTASARDKPPGPAPPAGQHRTRG